MGRHPSVSVPSAPASAHSCELRIGCGCCRSGEAGRRSNIGQVRTLLPSAESSLRRLPVSQGGQLYGTENAAFSGSRC